MSFEEAAAERERRRERRASLSSLTSSRPMSRVPSAAENLSGDVSGEGEGDADGAAVGAEANDETAGAESSQAGGAAASGAADVFDPSARVSQTGRTDWLLSSGLSGQPISDCAEGRSTAWDAAADTSAAAKDTADKEHDKAHGKAHGKEHGKEAADEGGTSSGDAAGGGVRVALEVDASRLGAFCDRAVRATQKWSLDEFSTLLCDLYHVLGQHQKAADGEGLPAALDAALDTRERKLNVSIA